ncbi:MAG TPA: DUF1674 domain-containing protein [Rhodanobacteraceae bacterium]
MQPPVSNQTNYAPPEDSHVREDMEKKNQADRDFKKVRKTLDPARYGDWEKGGRCIDF